MDNLSNKIQIEGEIPKEVVDFMDGRMAPKNESTAYIVIKNIFITVVYQNA